jgi:hypothetical protein
MDPRFGAIHASAKVTQLGAVTIGAKLDAVVIGVKSGAIDLGVEVLKFIKSEILS